MTEADASVAKAAKAKPPTAPRAASFLDKEDICFLSGGTGCGEPVRSAPFPARPVRNGVGSTPLFFPRLFPEIACIFRDTFFGRRPPQGPRNDKNGRQEADCGCN